MIKTSRSQKCDPSKGLEDKNIEISRNQTRGTSKTLAPYASPVMMSSMYS